MADILGLSDTVFSRTTIDIVDPATLSKSSGSAGLSIAAVTGIAVGAVVLVLVIAALILIRRRQRKNRARVGTEPRWGRTNKTHKRQSSFSFRCRDILTSPFSPKFFRDDLSPVVKDQQYGSLDEMASSQVSGITGEEQSTGRRYYIESKPIYERHERYAYEPAWSPQYAPPSFQSFAAPLAGAEEPGRQFGSSLLEKRNLSEKASLNIDTTLAPPEPAHQSPKVDSFSVLKSMNSVMSYASADSHGIASSPSQAVNGRSKTKTTTMSSQGSGYPSMKSPTTTSPPLKPKSGWPSPRENLGAWFPPPPPPGPPPKSSMRYGRKSSTGSIRKIKKEGGSPVESRQIQVSFPAPPQR